MLKSGPQLGKRSAFAKSTVFIKRLMIFIFFGFGLNAESLQNKIFETLETFFKSTSEPIFDIILLSNSCNLRAQQRLLLYSS